MILEGFMYKLGGFDLLQERYFTLSDRSLLRWYSDSDDVRQCGKEKGTLDVLGAKVIDRGTYLGKKCFTIEGENLAKGTKEYFLFCDSHEEKWKWLSAVMVASERYTFLEIDDEVNAKRLAKSPVADLVRVQGNDVCADCGRKHPTWSVGAPFGVFVCIDCIGVHRGLHANRCKEIQLDMWSHETREFFASNGNIKSNAFLEFCVPNEVFKPTRGSSPHVREKYIQLKYSSAFVPNDQNSSSRPPVTDPSVIVGCATAMIPPPSLGSPPRYIGVLFVRLHGVQNECIPSARATLTNGFQEVTTLEEGKKTAAKDTTWNENLQIGIDHVARPLYLTVYSRGKIHGTSELNLDPEQGDAEKDYTVAMMGKGVPSGAVVKFTIIFAKMT